MSKKVKVFAIVILIITALIALSAYFGNSTGSTTPKTVSPINSSSKVAGVPTAVITPTQGNDFSAILSTVNGINIDTSIFSNPAYKTLRDYPVALGSDIVGRPNPFAPIGYDVATAPLTPTQIQFETLQPSKILQQLPLGLKVDLAMMK